MPFAISKGEKSLTDLVKRLFNIKGPSSQTQIQQASDALLKANPQLKNLSQVAPGTPIAIPAQTPPVRQGELASGADLAQLYSRQNIQSAFESFAQRLGEIETTATSRIKTGVAQLEAQDVSAAMKKLNEQGARFENESMDKSSEVDPMKALQSLLDGSQMRLQALSQLRESIASFATTTQTAATDDKK